MDEHNTIRTHVKKKLKKSGSYMTFNGITFSHAISGYNVYEEPDHMNWSLDFEDSYRTFCELSGWDDVYPDPDWS